MKKELIQVPRAGFFPANIDQMSFIIEKKNGSFTNMIPVKRAWRKTRFMLMGCRSHTSTLENCEQKKRLFENSHMVYVKFQKVTANKIKFLMKKFKEDGLYPVIVPGKWVAGNKGARNWYQFLVSDEENIARRLIEEDDPVLWKKMAKLSIFKNIDRIGLVMGEQKKIRGKIKVKILTEKEIEENNISIGEGEGFATSELFKKNKWDFKVKTGKVSKALLFKDNKICKKFDADVVISEDDNKLNLTEKQFAKHLCWKPSMYGKGYSFRKPTFGIDQMVIQNLRIKPAELDEIIEDLEKDTIPFERAVQLLSYRDEEDNLQVPNANKSVVLGATINDGPKLLILKAFTTAIRKTFRRNIDGTTGTLINIDNIPKNIPREPTVLLTYPDMAPIFAIIKRYKGDIGISMETAHKLGRDFDGDVASEISPNYFKFTIPADEYKFEHPEEKETDKEPEMIEAWAKIVGHHNEIGPLYNGSMTLISAAHQAGKDEETIKTLLAETRTLTEQVITNFKGNNVLDTPDLEERAAAHDIPWHIVEREMHFSRSFRSGRIDTIIETAKEENAKDTGGWFEWACSFFKNAKISKAVTDTNKEPWAEIDKIRRKSFIHLKEHVQKRNDTPPDFWKNPDFGEYGKIDEPESLAGREINIRHNMEVRYRWCRKNIEDFSLHNFLRLLYIRREYEFGGYLWEKWWKKAVKDLEKQN